MELLSIIQFKKLPVLAFCSILLKDSAIDDTQQPSMEQAANIDVVGFLKIEVPLNHLF